MWATPTLSGVSSDTPPCWHLLDGSHEMVWTCPQNLVFISCFVQSACIDNLANSTKV